MLIVIPEVAQRLSGIAARAGVQDRSRLYALRATAGMTRDYSVDPQSVLAPDAGAALET